MNHPARGEKRVHFAGKIMYDPMNVKYPVA